MERESLNAPKTVSEIFDEVCPWYMASGMTYEEFWYKDPTLAYWYRRKREAEDRRENERAWLYGRYEFVAVATALTNAFRKEGRPAIDYPKEPFETKAVTERDKELRQKKALDESIKQLEAMSAKRRKGKKNGNA